MNGDARLDFDIVRHPRARRARLSVDPASGRVRLTLPRRAALGPALAWADEKRDWIARQQARLPAPRPFTPGATLPFGDGELTIDWDPARSRVICRDGARLVCGGPRRGGGRPGRDRRSQGALGQLLVVGRDPLQLAAGADA